MILCSDHDMGPAPTAHGGRQQELGGRVSASGSAASLPVVLAVGTQVAYLGPDLSDVMLWHGHPGFVVAGDLGPSAGCAGPWVAFVRGRVISLDPGDLRVIDSGTYYSRSDRLLQGRHPVEDCLVQTYPPSPEPLVTNPLTVMASDSARRNP